MRSRAPNASQNRARRAGIAPFWDAFAVCYNALRGMNQLGSIQIREGDLLAGKYRVERLIGAGGMGVVVAARHEDLDQLVAIKLVRDEALGNEEAVERFLREARSAGRLRSEHIARVLDVGKLDSGAPYMVMEFLEGNDLAQTLLRDGPMPSGLAVALMLQVCEAVAEAHSAGIVHRDLKPENLFLTQTVGGSPKVKVLDFGVSKSMRLADDPMAKLTATRTVLGSPLYMPPEQMRSSRDVDARGDVWALGVVLFELLTGRSPFEAETMPELCVKIVSEPPLSLAEFRPDLSPSLVAVVARCLEKERDRRFENAAQLATALEEFAPPPGTRLVLRSPLGASMPGNPTLGTLASGVAPFDEASSLRATMDGPGAMASIPAAWGAVESASAPPKRRNPVPLAAATAFAVVAGVALVTLRHPEPSAPAATTIAPASPRPSAPALPDLAPPAAPEVPVAPAVRLSDLPPAEAITEASATKASIAAPPGPAVAGAKSGSPADLYRRKVPASPGATGVTAPPPAGTDDDIPSLR
jgi:serine/threonine protein kinase